MNEERIKYAEKYRAENKEKIEELENQIELLKKQIKAIKSETKIDWTKYYMFGGGEYTSGLCHFKAGGVTEKVRGLALRLLSLYEYQREDGERAIWADKLTNARKLTKAQTDFVNGFIDEMYPTVEKYAFIALKNNELQGGKAK